MAATSRSNSEQSCRMSRSSAVDFHFDSTDAEDPVSWTGQFPMRNGGRVVFTLTASSAFNIMILPDTRGADLNLLSTPSLGIRIGQQSAEMYFSRGKGYGLRVLSSSQEKGSGFRRGKQSTYWLSYDPANLTISYGQGVPNLLNVILAYTFDGQGLKHLPGEDQERLLQLFQPADKLVQLQNYHDLPVVEGSVFQTPLLRKRGKELSWAVVDKEPLYMNPSPRLLHNSKMLLSDLCQEDFTFPAHLPCSAQSLACKVLQPSLTLEACSERGSEDDFANAIAYSLKSPGSMLHSFLKRKAKESGLLENEVSLSVGLTAANGSAPGRSVSLEILPPGHLGPLHNNARTYGALRVLHGEMDVSLYNDDVENEDLSVPLDEVDLGKGDAMWFSPTWYQTHAMSCQSKNFCCYILARGYADDDDIRWPYLDCKDGRGQSYKVKPEADLSFSDLYSGVLQELERALKADPDACKEQPSAEIEVDRTASLRTEAWVDCTDFSSASDPGENAQDRARARSKRYGCWNPLQGLTKKQSVPSTPRLGFILEAPEMEQHATESLATMWP